MRGPFGGSCGRAIPLGAQALASRLQLVRAVAVMSGAAGVHWRSRKVRGRRMRRSHLPVLKELRSAVPATNNKMIDASTTVGQHRWHSGISLHRGRASLQRSSA